MSRPAISPALPFAVATLGIALFSVMDAVMKGLSIAIGAYNAMFWRLVLGFLLAGTAFLIVRPGWPSRAGMILHLKRGTVASAMAISFFWGIARVPLAEGIALSFIAPLIALYLAAVLLGEKIGRAAIMASALGLAGVFVMLADRAGGGVQGQEVRLGIAAVLVSAVLYAWNLILQRQQAQVASPLEIALFQNMVAGGILALFAPFLARYPEASHWPSIAAATGLAFVSLLLMSWAYARAEAQILLPVEYTAFGWAALLGWLWFAEPVTPATLIGAGLIVIGCVIAARQKPATPAHAEVTAV